MKLQGSSAKVLIHLSISNKSARYKQPDNATRVCPTFSIAIVGHDFKHPYHRYTITTRLQYCQHPPVESPGSSLAPNTFRTKISIRMQRRDMGQIKSISAEDTDSARNTNARYPGIHGKVGADSGFYICHSRDNPTHTCIATTAS